MSKPETIGSPATNASNQPTIDQDEVKNKKLQNTSKPTIFLSMTESQARAEGSAVLNLFLKYDKDGSKDISDKEFCLYQGIDSGKVADEKDMEKKIIDVHNMPAEKKLETMVSTAYNAYGLNDDAKVIYKKFQDNKTTESKKISQDKFNIDLSKYNNVEDKQQAFTEGLKKRYEENLDNKDSLYTQNYERIKRGEYNDYEKNTLHLRGDLSEEQIKKFAKIATDRLQLMEVTSFFAEGDDDAKSLMINSISSFNSEIQTVIIGTAIYSAKDKKTREKFAEVIESKGVKLTDANGEKAVYFSVSAVIEHLRDENKQMNFLFGGNNKFEGNTQSIGFKAGAMIAKARYEAGEITEKEYNRIYTDVYAANAYRLDDAEKGYEYLINNASDSNRENTLTTLAANAYLIKDVNQRNNAITNIRSSQGYNEQVELNLLKSQLNSIANTQNNKPITLNNPNDYNKALTAIINDAEPIIGKENLAEAITNYTENVVNSEKTSNQTRKIKELFGKSISQILNIVIGHNIIQGSKHEGEMLKHLGAISTPTLTNMFLSTSENTQNYLWKHKEDINLSIINIMSLGTEEQIKALPDEIKNAIKDIYDREPQKAF